MSVAIKSWQERERENRVKSGILTALISVLVLALFLWLGLYTPFPPPEAEGLLIDFGFEQTGLGREEPRADQATTPPPVTEEVQTAIEEFETQDLEQAPALPEEPAVEQPVIEQPIEEPVETVAEPVPEQTVAEVPEPEEQIDENLLFSSDNFNFESNSNSQGDRQGDGNMGNPTGDDSQNYFGDESTGLGDEGLGYSLTGRKLVRRPPVDKNFQEFGDIVVDITVNAQGVVTSAAFHRRGSTITNPALIKKYLAAAKKARFDRSPEQVEQRGTITFHLKLK